MEAVLIAFFGTLTALFSWLGKRHAKATRDDMKTNHGKRPGEYLEMVADVKTAVTNVRSDFASHALQDAENFSKLATEIATLKTKDI